MGPNCIPIILTILCLTAGYRAAGQNIDSLKLSLQNAKGKSVCFINYRLGYELVDVEFAEALSYAEASIRCAKQYNDTLQLVRSTQLKATAFRRLGEFDSSNVAIMSILPIARKNEFYVELQDLLHGLALGLLYKARFDESLKYNFEALEIRKVHGTPQQIGLSLSNIGYVYYKLADYPRALEYFNMSIPKLAVEPAEERSIQKVLVNIALSHAYSNDAQNAHKFIRAALDRCRNDCSAEDLQNIAFCRGIVSLSIRDTAAAKNYFFESYSRAIADSHERLQLDNIIYLSRIFLGTGEVREAEHYLGLAEQLILKGVPYNMELMNVYQQFADLYERQRNYKRVAEFQRRHMALKDSIYDDEVTTSLMRIEVAHVEREKNAKIETQSKLLELNERIMSRQRMITILASVTVLLLIGFVVMLVRIIRDKKIRNEDLEARVRSRTVELERMVEQSRKWLDERRLWMQKILYSVNHTAKTIEGLSSLATIDPESNVKCVELIDREMQRLLVDVNGYASRSNSIGEELTNADSMA